MTYSAIHKKIIIETEDLSRSVNGILWAMKKYRQSANVPLGKRKIKGVDLSDFDMAERELLQSLKVLGLDFGVEWGKDLDLTGLG